MRPAHPAILVTLGCQEMRVKPVRPVLLAIQALWVIRALLAIREKLAEWDLQVIRVLKAIRGQQAMLRKLGRQGPLEIRALLVIQAH